MFDFGSGELLVIGVVALVVIGPKELPGLLRTVGQTVTRLRRIAGDFQGQFQSALREADLHDALSSVSDLQKSTSETVTYNDPLANLPMPSLPEPATEPPAELKSPTPVVPSPSNPPASHATTPNLSAQKSDAGGTNAEDSKPARARSKKAAEKADDPQAALFDTLDQMTKKAESKAQAKPATKSSGAGKSKATPKAPAKAIAKTPAKSKPKAATKSADKPKRKSRTGEASS